MKVQTMSIESITKSAAGPRQHLYQLQKEDIVDKNRVR